MNYNNRSRRRRFHPSTSKLAECLALGVQPMLLVSAILVAVAALSGVTILMWRFIGAWTWLVFICPMVLLGITVFVGFARKNLGGQTTDGWWE